MMTVRKLLNVILIALVPIPLFAQDVEQATEEALETLDQMSVAGPTSRVDSHCSGDM